MSLALRLPGILTRVCLVLTAVAVLLAIAAGVGLARQPKTSSLDDAATHGEVARLGSPTDPRLAALREVLDSFVAAADELLPAERRAAAAAAAERLRLVAANPTEPDFVDFGRRVASGVALDVLETDLRTVYRCGVQCLVAGVSDASRTPLLAALGDFKRSLSKWVEFAPAQPMQRPLFERLSECAVRLGSWLAHQEVTADELEVGDDDSWPTPDALRQLGLAAWRAETERRRSR